MRRPRGIASNSNVSSHNSYGVEGFFDKYSELSSTSRAAIEAYKDNPKPLNPKPLDPKPLNPKPLNLSPLNTTQPQTLNPESP